MPTDISLFYSFHFYLFGLFAVVSALLFVTRKSPVTAALWLVSTMFSLAAMYVLLDAQFIAAMQVLVYAGAIMVVFLFVIMLLNLGHADELADARPTGWKLAASAVGIALLAFILATTRAKLGDVPLPGAPGGGIAADVAARGVIAPIAGPMFNEYLLAFEVTSMLLLAAVVGAVVVGKQRGRDSRPATARDETGGRP
jgi:NADH-quinone oxidoreductase subunit J